MKTQIEGFGLKDVIRNTSLAGWILLSNPVIYVLFSRRRDLSEYTTVDFTASIYILYSLIAFVIGIRTILNSESPLGKRVIRNSPFLIFMIYSILGVVSMFWSVNLPLTGYRAFESIAMTLLIMTVIQELFETCNKRYIMLWSLFYAVWECGWALIRTLRWTTDLGILMEASQFTATTFFFMALYFTPRLWYNWLVIIMSVFSMSTVGYLGMALGLMSSFWINSRTRVLALGAAFFILLGFISVGPYTLIKNTLFFDKEDISLENTNGRDHLMDAALESIDKYPVGLGFFAAEPYVLYAKGLGGISAHNSIFSAGMGLGYPGMILMGIFFISMGFSLFSKYVDSEVKPILIGCCCVAFMHCMGNPSLGSRVYAAWIPCAYVFILTCYFYVYGKYYSEEE